MSPRKVPVKSAEVKAQAVVKLRATRVARGTTGPKARSKVKGVVPAVPPTTGGPVVTSPATPAANTAPAPAKPTA